MKNLNRIIFASLILLMFSCKDFERQQQTSDSGVKKATTKVTTNPDGTTIEQRNIIERIKRDNELGSIKHLYIVSSYTGDVLQYSTVKGKVTSGNKRLSPKTVLSGQNNYGAENYVTIGNTQYTSNELIDDGGAYGDSGNYMYWFDAQGNYQQYYPSGGTYVQISDKPLRIKKSNLSLTIE
jgi:hypothetical protein